MTGQPAAPQVRAIGAADIRAALALGWRDFAVCPAYGLFFGAVYAAGGILLALAVTVWNAPWAILPFAVGFPLIGPFVAVGLYEVSRRREAGQPVAWPPVLGAILRERDRQIPTMAAVILGLFLAWLFIAHTIFALFLGISPARHAASTAEMLLSPDGLQMLAFGTAVGAGLAFVLFASTVIALPLLLDREVDFVTGMIASFGAVRAAPVPMLGWGVAVAALTFLAMLPAFLGLLVVLPVLGHASWHLYRRAIVQQG